MLWRSRVDLRQPLEGWVDLGRLFYGSDVSRPERSFTGLDRGVLLGALDAATVAIGLVRDQRLEYANRAFLDLFGEVSPGDSVGAAFTGLGPRFVGVVDRVLTT